MATNRVHLMTVEEYRALPDQESTILELHQGEIVEVTRPRLPHYRLQRRLRQLFEAIAGDRMVVEIEMPFRAVAEYELRAADVAVLSAERWRQASSDEDLQGAPDIVVEVLSPSNTAAEMFEEEQLCLSHGSQEFWMVDPKRRTVRVTTVRGSVAVYGMGDQISIELLDQARLKVDNVFV